MKETPSKPTSQRAAIDEALQERIRQYQRAETISYLAWFCVVAPIIVMGGRTLLTRQRAFFLLMSPGPAFLLHLLQVYQPLSIGIACVGAVMFIQVLLFPVTLANFLLRRRARLSKRKVTQCLLRWLKDAVRESASWLFEIQICYLLLITQPQTWWIWTPLLLFLYAICFALVKLLIIYPFGYHYHTITRPELLRMLHELTIDSGSSLPRIKQISRKTWKGKKPKMWLNGYATGWGRLRTIILTEDALRHCSPSEVRSLLAHELGHLVHHDCAKRLGLYAGVLFAVFFLYHMLYDWFLMLLKQAVAFRHPFIQPQLPIILVLALGIFAGTRLLQRAYSRYTEYQADEFALRITHDVASFKSLEIRMLNLRKDSLRVSAFQEWDSTHPSPHKRFAHADEFARRPAPFLSAPPLRLNKVTISRAWNLPPILTTTIPSTGTMHHVTLLSTATTQYVLRAYRYMSKERPRIVHEHTVAAYVEAQGLPAIAPLPLASGGTILEHQARIYALYPAAMGVQIPREQVTAPEIVAAMGRCLGELHQILAGYQQEGLRQPTFAVDPAETRLLLERIEAAIAEKVDQDELDQGVLSRLAQHKTWLHTAQAVDLTPFLSLERQVIHGDFQESNLFFAEGKVSAIIDWEKVCVAPRTWEILRMLDYVFDLDSVRSQLFLRAYREVLPVSADELALTARAYGWIQNHNLWAYRSFYLTSNHRVRHLLQSSFTPFETRWAKVLNCLFLC